ncbi:hypothetical protein RHGRI_017257 [Rhododendron griersonianum]|uniref:START domain-containing protein n=1 Tax=Rhododendron griersonianum TaxID=479676 RepID=A0AAV6JX75_9ERIC|nr:hypothetical protein RHGRI_017257 [Rhododendron griersonianum]
MENFETREMLKDEFCSRCKGISNEVSDHILELLQIEKSQLIDKYERLSNLLNSMGISASKRFSLPQSPGSSSDPQENFMGQRIGGISLHQDLDSTNHNDHIQLYREKQLEHSNMSHMALTIAKAANELSTLLVSESLWIKDPTNQRYVIHCKNYEKTFTKINHLKSSRVRFESSKVKGLVRMNATQLVEMLLDSEYEQMHILSPFVAPRDFYFLRYCHQIGEGEWMIVEVSYDIFHGSRERDCHSHSWRLPSGCIVRDLSNGCSMWDILAKGISFQEIAKMSYGDHTGNRISIIQPVISSGNNILVLQESSIDHLGAIVAYAPVDIASLDMAVNGRDSSYIPLVPSGFVISSDGHPGTTAGASTSTTTNPEGSLLTIVFQIQDCDASSLKHVSMEMVASVHALISSTVQSIKSALNCTSLA